MPIVFWIMFFSDENIKFFSDENIKLKLVFSDAF